MLNWLVKKGSFQNLFLDFQGASWLQERLRKLGRVLFSKRSRDRRV